MCRAWLLASTRHQPNGGAVGRGIFVGRGRELADIEHRLDAARDGSGSVVLVDGEAGMGKTALADELTGRAAQAGFRTCWGACVEAEGAPAFHPWRQILAELGPEARGLLARDVESRFQLFDDVVEVLRDAAGPDGLFVVLDDLHWADQPSMRLLQAVAAGVAGHRLVVLGLFRGGDVAPRSDLTDVLATLRRERTASQFTLAGLAPVEVAELARRTAPHHLDATALDALVQRAEGNPLFTVEMVRLSGTAGDPERVLPRGVRDVIGRRLARVQPDVRRLLQQAAVFGRDFSIDLVAELAELSAAHVAGSVDRAIDAELVAPGRGGSVRFTHALIQEVCYADLSATDRAQLHLRAARAIGDGPECADAIAHHLRQAGSLADYGAALAATLLAAGRARDQLGYEHAAFQYRQALDLISGQPGEQARTAELLVELAGCEFRAGVISDAWASCRRAADLARVNADAVVLGTAAMVIRGIVNDPITDEIHALCREALVLLDGRDPVLEARLLGQLAFTANAWAGAEPGLSERALIAAEATGDADARFLALQARHTDLTDFRCAPERLALGEQAVRLGRNSGRDEYVAWGHVARIEAFWQLSRRLQLDAELRALDTIAARMREPLVRWRLALIRASLALFEGRHREAAAFADEALQIGRRGGLQDVEHMDVIFRSCRAPMVGESLDDVEVYVRRFTGEGPFAARGWHAKILAQMGRTDEAAALFSSVLPHVASFPRFAVEWIIIMTSSANLCVSLGHREAAPVFYELLLPFADRQSIARPHAQSDGPVALYLGRLAMLLERWDDALGHLRTARHLAVEMGSPLFEAFARVDIARALQARRGPGDLRQAVAELTAAVESAQRLAIPSLEAEATSLLARARGGRSTALSAREEEVAALVADGLSNRQIATRLHLSERTVETHIRAIFNKLGFDSRARIAAWFAVRSVPDRVQGQPSTPG
jgi:DNA-binding CsgD family transcriptional regulator